MTDGVDVDVRVTNGRPPLPPEVEDLVRRPEPGSHRVRVEIGGQPVDTLADLPPTRNRLLFVGLSPSPASVEAGHHHQGRLGRRFWQRLVEARVLPPGTPIESADDALIAAGHGITDLTKRPSGRDDATDPTDPTDPTAATDAELTAGVGVLWQKIALWRPGAVVFIDKRGAEIAAGRPIAERWGQVVGLALAGRPCFLMPGAYAPAEEVAEGLNLLRNLLTALPD